jgi:uncharacterized RDD family membrane protein YckC
VAQFIDGLILGAIAVALMAILIIPMMLLASASGDLEAAASSAFMFTTCLAEVGVLIVTWLYYAGFESSRFMGTPGKLICGIRVTDLDGNGISFGKATKRFVLKILLNLFVYIGYLYILVSDKKQGLYDVVAGTIVIKYD